MKLKEVTKLLSEKDQEQEVEYMVIDKATSEIVSMNITDETADLMKLLKAFRPKKKAHNELSSPAAEGSPSGARG